MNDEALLGKDRAARMRCTNRSRPHRCARREAPLVHAGVLGDLTVLVCSRCSWPILVTGLVVVTDDREVDPDLQDRFQRACRLLEVPTQAELRTGSTRTRASRDQAKINAGFDERARLWERNRAAITLISGNDHRLKDIVYSAADDCPEGQHFDLADLGCGTGGLVAGAASRSGLAHFAGVDASLAMLRRAAERLGPIDGARSGTSFDLVLSPADCTPLRTGSFDLVTAELLIHHVAEPARVVAEMGRVARPGGLVVIQVPGPGYSLDANFGRGWRTSRIEPKSAPGNIDPLGRFSVEELQQLALAVGLRPDHVDVDRWTYRFETLDSCLGFLARTGADARLLGYATPVSLLDPLGHLLDVGPVEVRGEFATLTATKPVTR